jgi:two-component system chemotaxis sensor kinase CheA
MGATTQPEVQAALHKQQEPLAPPRLGELLVRSGEVSARDVSQALRTQRVESQAAGQLREVVKVDADRLDRLVNLIGELVIAESMVSQSCELRGGVSAQLGRHMAQLDKITRELQEMGTSLRMVPVRPTFQKMARLVRDLAKKAGKPVEFVMSGEDTELDRAVVEKIGDPLVHMIRNAVDHGLEATPAERRAAGKPDTGRVELRAFHKGGNIHIEVEDDGRGLHREVILAKARERGVVREGEVLSDREVYNLIFEAGFSTAKEVTDVSGRGVGMDVVRRNVEALRGQVDIRTEPGQGSVFSIRLPLTLAIIDGMVIRVGAERYVIPTLAINRCMRPGPADLKSVLGCGEMLNLQGSLMPLFRLGGLFNIRDAKADPAQSIAVIVENDGSSIALLADALLGQQQIVIKSLGDSLRGTPGISGGAIMPDGRVGLILDVGGLIRLAGSSGCDRVLEGPNT